jgi:hypothetical protein
MRRDIVDIPMAQFRQKVLSDEPLCLLGGACAILLLGVRLLEEFERLGEGHRRSGALLLQLDDREPIAGGFPRVGKRDDGVLAELLPLIAVGPVNDQDKGLARRADAKAKSLYRIVEEHAPAAARGQVFDSEVGKPHNSSVATAWLRQSRA